MGPITIRVKFQTVFEVYSLSQATFVFWSELGNFLEYVFLAPPPPQFCAIELRRYSCSTLARGKRKHIMRFEIRYFYLQIGLSPGLTQSKEKSI